VLINWKTIPDYMWSFMSNDNELVIVIKDIKFVERYSC